MSAHDSLVAWVDETLADNTADREKEINNTVSSFEERCLKRCGYRRSVAPFNAAHIASLSG
jgi:hypothetical protein